MSRARHTMTITATKAHCRLAFSAPPQRISLPLLVWLHGSTDTTSRKSAIEEKMFSRKVTLPSTLIFSAKDVWTINLTDSFYLYLYLKPHEKCFFSDGGLRDRDIIFRDERDLVFCFLECVLTFPAREANSWRRRATSNWQLSVCFFLFFSLPTVLAFFFFTIKRRHSHKQGKGEDTRKGRKETESSFNF